MNGYYWTNAINAWDWILQQRVISVVNCSFTNFSANQPVGSIRIVLRRLVDAGIVVVGAAGNNTNDIAGLDGIFGVRPGQPFVDDALPAALADCMAVSSMNPTNDVFSPFSNFNAIDRTINVGGQRTPNLVNSPGAAIDLAAPGENILSTYVIRETPGLVSTNDQHIYAYLGGTSMAAPHVTALVALYIAANGRATNAAGVYKIRQAIVDACLHENQKAGTYLLNDADTNHEPIAVVSEEWVPHPTITQTALTTNGFEVQFTSVPGYSYAVEQANTLTEGFGVWSASTNLAGTGGPLTAILPVTNDPIHFVRISRFSGL